MGASHGDFVKYPRTPHLFGAIGTADDKKLDEKQSLEIISDDSLIIEEKLDGTNVGIHFDDSGEIVLQCRGQLITASMHAQYDLFKQWALVKRDVLQEMLGQQFILFGEWMHARHSIFYQSLSHYFFEFDIWDKTAEAFLSLESRLDLLDKTGIETVPVVHREAIDREQLYKLIGPSAFKSCFDNPVTRNEDNLMEGLYLRTESDGFVSRRAKVVRPEFVEKVKQSSHWQQLELVVNQLREDVDIWQ